MRVRGEQASDRDAVRHVHQSAFETQEEADLVDRLRARAQPTLSLVAEVRESVVGHIFFSPVHVSTHPDLRVMGLGPVAVLPDHQRQGIGSRLIRAGLDALRQRGWDAVVLVGHPEYYPRFGFQRAGSFGLECEFDVPPEAFMAKELVAGAFTGRSGRVEYHPAFRGE